MYVHARTQKRWLKGVGRAGQPRRGKVYAFRVGYGTRTGYLPWLERD